MTHTLHSHTKYAYINNELEMTDRSRESLENVANQKERTVHLERHPGTAETEGGRLGGVAGVRGVSV